MPLPAFLIVCALHGEAPLDSRAIMARLDALARARDWAGQAAYIEGLPPANRLDLALNWADALVRSSQWAKLLALCDDPALRGKDGRPLFPLRARAAALGGLGRYREAVVAYREMLKGGDILAALSGWNASLGAADWKAAEEFGSALAAKFPTSGEYVGMHGEALSRQGRFKEALVVLEKAAALSPRRAMTWADLGCCLNEAGRYQEAYDAASKAVELDPRNMEGWQNRGRACMGLKRYEEGRDHYAMALSLNPEDPAVAANLRHNIAAADAYLAYQARAKGPAKASAKAPSKGKPRS
ncbi:MAG TPA: tetratricopeptide repeat protein [Holophaga sp.]|nr:tetratricopeptide repeat protein [Holophaga sp.]